MSYVLVVIETTGFPTGVENMGGSSKSNGGRLTSKHRGSMGSSKFDGGGFCQYMGGAWRGALNAVKKYL